jgi:hypothetical protein
LLQAFAAWNDGPAAFSFRPYYDLPIAKVSVQFSTDDDKLGGSPARAYVSWYCGHPFHSDRLISAAVYFDSRFPYTTDSATAGLAHYGGTRYLFQTAAVHELGHALGLNHTFNRYSVMGTNWNFLHANCGVSTAYVGEDGTSGARSLYGTLASQDVAVAHWMHLGASDGYSTHQRTKVYDAAGAILPRVSIAGEQHYIVYAGQRVLVEATVENNGSAFQNTEARLYLSPDNCITPSDRVLSVQARSIGPGSAFGTSLFSIIVPADARRGQAHFLGIGLDGGNSVAEFNESNNYTYLPVWVSDQRPPSNLVGGLPGVVAPLIPVLFERQ